MTKSKYAKLLSPSVTPQTEPINERQVQNNAGGFVFQLDMWKRLERFLILGSDAPTYYQTAQKLTKENAKCVQECLSADPERTIRTIVEVSEAGRAPKNDPAIFALALATVHEQVRARTLAYSAVSKVCRTATHLMQFVDTARGLGKGFGRGMKRAVASWYDDKSPEKLAYQAVKYRSREGYTHERLIDLSRPSAHVGDPAYDGLYKWMIGKDFDAASVPPIVRGHLTAMGVEKDDTKTLLPLVTEHRLPWEALPTWANANADVWEAQLPFMGMTALIRNLGNMTRHGTIKPLSAAEKTVVERLHEVSELKKARVHPFHVLQAMHVYSGGRSLKGGRTSYAVSAPTWTPSQAVLDALNDAFYLAFQAVEPTGKRHLLGIDVSASMSSPFGGSTIACNEAAACMALVTMNVEPQTHAMMFDQGMRDSKISPKDRLDTALKKIKDINGGGTDCALPMLYALDHKLEVDVFEVLTDSETWAGGRGHPVQALNAYRQKTGIPAKLVVVGMTSTGFTIADPNDGGMLDCVGMDSATPAVISEFVRD